MVYPEKWFWIMMENMGLTRYDDEHFDVDDVNRIVDIWLERRFGSDGMGSPFPLQHPFEDQRQIELWQQMQNYVNERC